jgi:hypothetical protein
LTEDKHRDVRIRTANHATQTARFTQSARVFDEIKILGRIPSFIEPKSTSKPQLRLHRNRAHVDFGEQRSEQEAALASLLKNMRIGPKLTPDAQERPQGARMKYGVHGRS